LWPLGLIVEGPPALASIFAITVMPVVRLRAGHVDKTTSPRKAAVQDALPVFTQMRTGLVTKELYYLLKKCLSTSMGIRTGAGGLTYGSSSSIKQPPHTEHREPRCYWVLMPIRGAPQAAAKQCCAGCLAGFYIL
jgi:hypothetical protein